MELADDALAADDDGEGQANVADAGVAVDEDGEGHGAAEVVDDGLEDEASGLGDAVAGVAFLFEDVVSGLDGLFEEGDGGVGGVDAFAAGEGDGEGGELGVAVLAEDIGAEVVRVDGEFGGHEGAEAGGVEEGAGADDTLRREVGELEGVPGHGVDGVSDDDEDGVGVGAGERGDQVAEEGDVGGEDAGAGGVGRAGGGGADDDDVGVAEVGEIGGGDAGGVGGKSAGVLEVGGFAVGDDTAAVDEDEFVGEALEDDGVGDGGAYLADADDGDFHGDSPRPGLSDED